MTFRRAVVSLTITAALTVGITGCSGNDQTSPPVTDTPSSTTPTPTPVDPTAAAKAKVLADYAVATNFRAQGMLSNQPTYPYQRWLTGNALQTAKSVGSGMQLSGRKYTGSFKYLKGTVAALNLKTKPATATVEGCVYSGIVLRDKKGTVVSDPPSNLTTNDQLVLIGQRWMVTETQAVAPEGDCK